MFRTRWDDPLNRARDTIDTHGRLILPDTGPSNLELIRQQQLPLAEAMRALRQNANEVLRRAAHPVVAGSGCDLTVEVVYRLPDHPDLVNYFITTITDDFAVEVARRDQSEIARRLIETPSAADIVTSKKLQRIVSTNEPSATQKSDVVFPGLFGFLATWIERNEGPIADVQFMIQPLRRMVMQYKPDQSPPAGTALN